MQHYLPFMSFKRQLNVNCLCFDEFMSWFHQQNTTNPDDFTASYKFRSLKRFLSRGDLSHRKKGYKQINVK